MSGILSAGGLLQGVAGITSAITNPIMQAKTNRMNRQLTKYGYEQEKQMIREQNEYNTPVNQMKRFKEAGLNPNLIYGQGTPGNQSQIAKYHAPRQEAPQFDANPVISGIGAIYSTAKTKADIDNVNAMTEVQKQEAKNRAVDYFAKQLGVIKQYKIMPSELGKAQADYRSTIAQIDKINQEKITSSAQEQFIRAQTLATKRKDNYFKEHGYLPSSGAKDNMMKEAYEFVKKHWLEFWGKPSDWIPRQWQ